MISSRLRGKNHNTRRKKAHRRGGPPGPTKVQESKSPSLSYEEIPKGKQQRKHKPPTTRVQSRSESPFRALFARGTLASTVLYLENKKSVPLLVAEELLAELTA